MATVKLSPPRPKAAAPKIGNGAAQDFMVKDLSLAEWGRKTIEISENANLDEIGARIFKDSGLDGSFGTYRPNERQIDVYVYTFWKSSQAKYLIDQKRLVVEDRRFRWDHFLTGMHARGGYEHPAFLEYAWAGVVDLVCLGFIVWIATGIYMWWQLRRTRSWGFLALGSGVLLFLVFLLAL